MSESVFIAEMTVEAVVTQWPQTADVFARRNMACVGCPVSHLYTVSEAADVYQLSPVEFVTELEAAINGDAAKDQ